MRWNDLITNYLILKYEIFIINKINVINLNNNLTNLAKSEMGAKPNRANWKFTPGKGACDTAL